MRDEDLVCAACAGRAVEGRCRVCRASRLGLQRQQPALPAGPLLATAAALIVLILLLNVL